MLIRIYVAFGARRVRRQIIVHPCTERAGKRVDSIVLLVLRFFAPSSWRVQTSHYAYGHRSRERSTRDGLVFIQKNPSWNRVEGLGGNRGQRTAIYVRLF